MKVLMQDAETFAAAGTLANALTGERYERPPFNAMGDLYITGSVINTSTSELNVGGTSITPPTAMSGANRMPLVPDDVQATDWPVRRGDLIQLTLVATAAVTIFWRVDLESVI